MNLTIAVVVKAYTSDIWYHKTDKFSRQFRPEAIFGTRKIVFSNRVSDVSSQTVVRAREAEMGDEPKSSKGKKLI